ncbi:MAG TPA: MGMT family protein [Candidatus Baltobacteraceae bacterium]|jgi:methylated-DNA-[protein]-cysteine S-methyltransferase
MRCRDVEALWDDIREGMPPLREAVQSHLRACPPCQELYEQYEGVAYCLSCLPQPQPSCDLAAKIVEHIAQIKHKYRSTPITLTAVATPIGLLYVGFKEARITFIGIDRGDPFESVRDQVERRLRRTVQRGEAPEWLRSMIANFFKTWHVDQQRIDISDLTPFEQAALKAAAQIPPGEVRSYAWVAREIGRPRAARAVGQAMARNPLPLLFPCHRVVDSNGDLHNYGYGIEMKARLLKMEGYER